MAYNKVTLTGTYRKFDDTPATGSVEIIPSEHMVKDTTGNVILSGRVKVALDETGSFSVDLPATDDPTLNPTNFGYTVVAKLHHKSLAPVSFSLPAAVPVVDIEDVTTVDPSTFTPGVTYVTPEQLSVKANIADVDTALAAKANTTDVDAALALKANASSLAAKVDTTDPRLSDARPPTAHGHPWGEVTGKPTTFKPDVTDPDLTATFARRATRRPPASIQATATYTGGQANRAAWLSADGKRLYDYSATTLSYSTNEGLTWTPIHNFGAGNVIYGMREMSNGELLVGIWPVTGSGHLWTSAGWSAGTGTPTWTKTLTMSGPARSADNSWSFSPPLHHMDDLPPGVNMGIMVVGEYGDGNLSPRPRNVYASQDNGQTWSTVYAIDDALLNTTHHVHGVCYDPWGDAVWMSVGDGEDSTALRYSTDWRNGAAATWTEIDVHLPGGTFFQPLQMWPLPGRILMMSDQGVNGLQAVDRAANGGYEKKVKSVYLLNDVAGLTHLGGVMYRRPGHALLIPYRALPGTDYYGRTGRLLATQDGYEFAMIWQEPVPYTTANTYGVQGAFGPTLQGNLVAAVTDDKRTNGGPGETRLLAPWPAEEEITHAGDAKRYADSLSGIKITSPFISEAGVVWLDTAGAWTLVQKATLTLPQGWQSALVTLSGWIRLRVDATSTPRQFSWSVRNSEGSITMIPYPLHDVPANATGAAARTTAPVTGTFVLTGTTEVILEARVTSTNKTAAGIDSENIDATMLRLT